MVDPAANRVLHFNQGALRLTGLAGYDLSRLPAAGLFPGQLAELTNFTRECEEHERAWTSRLELVRTHGETLPVEVFGSSFERQGRSLLLLMCEDAKRNRVRRAKVDIDAFNRNGGADGNRFDFVFRELERGNQLILQAVGEGIYGVDARGAFTFLNAAAERMLGFTAAEALGRNGHSLIHHSLENGDPYPHKACPIYAAFKDRTIRRVDNEVFWRKDGSCFPVEYTSTPIIAQGRALGAVVVFRDVSAQRRAREELEQALAEVRSLQHRLELENAYLQDELLEGASHPEIVGTSDAVRRILRQIELVGPTDATVLITGESGPGKEVIARAIHHASERRHRPLIRVNCAAIPRELFESEFFGHVRGAFTGAVAERVGRFELADGGTIFLDEVGEIPLELQGKLLRILQEQQFERVGETRTRDVDVRVIAATNRNLRDEVEARRFREDLYFRLNVFPIVSPPLRERVDDIAQLAARFMRRACARAHRAELPIRLSEVERMKRYPWPGNIRELENVIERAVITSVDGKLRLDLPTEARTLAAPSGPAAPVAAGVLTASQQRDAERENIVRALRQCRGRVAGANGAAALLGMPPTTLYSRITRLGIDARGFRREDETQSPPSASTQP
ncbi:MAG: sigma 54-interacting transcriptional regulator [Burkholderiaceae bacterium]